MFNSCCSKYNEHMDYILEIAKLDLITCIINKPSTGKVTEEQFADAACRVVLFLRPHPSLFDPFAQVRTTDLINMIHICSA